MIMGKILLFSWHKELPARLLEYVKNHRLEFHMFTATGPSATGNDEDDVPCIVHAVGSGMEAQMKNLPELLRGVVGPNDQCIIYTGGKYPQETHLLAHLLIQKFPERVRFYSEKNEEIPFIDDDMYTFRFYHHVHEFLESGNFLSAKQAIANRLQHKDIDKLLDFANGLFSLELESKAHPNTDMFELLKDKLREIGGDEEEIQYVERMKGLKRGSQKEFIFFIYNYAAFLYEQEDLIDFVVLYYRLVEESLLYAIGWDYVEHDGPGNGYRFIKQPGNRFVLPLQPQQMSRYFHHYLRALKQEIRRIEQKYAGVFIRNGYVNGLERLNERERYFVRVHLAFHDEALNDFLDLRHEGVSGHGFADFTVEDFVEICGGVTPLETIEPILEELGLIPEFSLFELVQKVVLGLLKEEYEWQR